MALQEQIKKVVEKLQALLAYPQEDLDAEFKSWLNLSLEDDKADLAQAILALANHGGGHVILGFCRSTTGLERDANRPTDLSAYSSEAINNIVKRYAEPRFQCRVDLVNHPLTDELFPIITVPGDHKIPIRAKSETQTRRHVRVNAYYIRRPGPESSEPQTAQEWDELIRRCVVNSREDLLSHVRNIIQGFGSAELEALTEQSEDDQFRRWLEDGTRRFNEWTTDHLSPETRFLAATSHWIGAYWIQQDLGKITARQLRNVLKQVERPEPGGPYWYVPLGAYESDSWYSDGVIEAGNKPRPSVVPDSGLPFTFWRASLQGLMLLIRGYDEDFESSEEDPQTRLRAADPIWDVAACCCHCTRLAKALGAPLAQVTLGCCWKGLRDRRLTGVRERKDKERLCRQQSASAIVRCSVGDIETNLPEIVRDLTTDLYQGFSFFEPSMTFIEEQISELKRVTPRILDPV